MRLVNTWIIAHAQKSLALVFIITTKQILFSNYVFAIVSGHLCQVLYEKQINNSMFVIILVCIWEGLIETDIKKI